MSTCPFCKAPLSDADRRAGKCSTCGQLLDAAGDDRRTTDYRSMEKTVEHAGVLPASLGDASPPGGQSGVGETIEKPVVEEDSPPKKPGTVPDRRIAPTVDVQGLSPADAERMTNMWGAPVQRQSNPLVTIKGHMGETVRESTLVLQPRALRHAADQQAGNADYQLLDKLGEGGMGLVYLARQAAINRIVALKMLKSDTSADMVQRSKFLSEAVVTGDLDHPNIVPIYDLGTDEQGLLFYSMKRVLGTPWLAVIEQKSLHENLEILMRVADAVAFAHSRGVVHRDLKPENVMLGDFGEVLLLDWGLAVPTAAFEKSASITQSSAMGGTPAYMAPEMATGPLDRVGPASDIYLLGAVLYEIVTGKPPHTGKDVMRCLFAAAKNEIQPTDKTGELVEIAVQAMATRPEDRYASVQEFQESIRRYLSHTESIALSARAAEGLEQARRTDDYQDYARSLFTFQEAGALWEGNAKAKSGQSEASLAYAESAKRKGDYDLGASLLDRANPNHARPLAEIRDAQREREMRQQRLKTLRLVTRVGLVVFLVVVTGASLWIWMERNKALAAEKEAKAQTAIAVDQKHKADAATRRAVASQAVAEGERRNAEAARDRAQAAEKTAVDEREKAVAAKFDADRQRDNAQYQAYIALVGLAAAKIEENAFDTARQLLNDCPQSLRRWEWGRLKHLCSQTVTDYDVGAPVESVAFSRRGGFITSGWNGLAVIWDADTGQVRRTLKHGELSFVHAAALSPDGKWAATGSNDPSGGFLRLWNAETGQPAKTFEGHADAVASVAFSGDGRRLLSGSFDHTAKLWDVESGRLLRTFHGHRGWVWAAAFCYEQDKAGNALPERRIVTASQDGFAIVWRLDKSPGDAQEQSPPFRGHQGPVYTAAFSPDGQSVATGGYDNRILIWKPSELRPFQYENVIYNETLPPTRQEGRKPVTPPQFRALDGHSAPVRSVGFDRDGNRLLSGGSDNTVRIWDFQSGKLLKTLRGHGSRVRACAFSPDGKWVLSGSEDQRAKRWSIERYEEVRRIAQGRLLEGHSGDILGAAFSRDGKLVVTASRDRTARTWDFDTAAERVCLQEGHAFLASRAVFFPGDKWLLTAAIDDTARVWDVAAGAELARLDLTGRHAAAAVSPDGKWILTGSHTTAAKLWEFVVGKDAEGRVVHEVKLRRELGGHKTLVTEVAFSPDSRFIFTGDANGRGRLWDASDKTNVRQLHDLTGHTARITAAVFLPNSQRLLTASGDGTVAQWAVQTGQELRDLILPHSRGQTVTSLATTSDGRYALTSCDDGSVRFWDVDRAKVLRTLTPRRPVLDSQGKPVGVVNAVAVSSDDRLAATVNSEAQTVRLWDLETGNEIELPAQDGKPGPFLDFSRRGLVWSASFSTDGSQIATVGGDNARLWDVRRDTRPERETQIFIPHGSVAAASFSPDGKRVVTSSWDASARIWNVQTGRDELKLEGGHHGAVHSAVFSPDGAQVLTASSDKTAVLWDAQTGKILQTFRGHAGAVRRAVFSSDGKRILTASEDATARIWNAQSGEQVQVLPGHKYGVLSAAFSANDQFVVTGGEDNTARIWEVATGQTVLTLEGHTAAVTSVTFSPDGKRVLTGSEDFTAKLWDAEVRPASGAERGPTGAETPRAQPGKGKEILTLKGHEQEVTSVAFSTDGVYALTGSRDGAAIIWLADDQWRK